MYDYKGSDSPFDNDVISVVIKNGLTSIGTFAFFDCNNLTSVIIGNGVVSIGEEILFSFLCFLGGIGFNGKTIIQQGVKGLKFNLT